MLLPKFMGAEESPGTTEVPQGFSINAVALPRVCDSACIGNITSEMVFFFLYSPDAFIFYCDFKTVHRADGARNHPR